MYIVDNLNYEYKKFYKCAEIASSLLDKPISSFKHFSFIMKGNKICSIGWNNINADTIKINRKYIEYPLGGVHSEADAISKLDDLNICKKATLVNIRLNKQGQLRMSKPCPVCSNLLQAMGFTKMYYSNDFGFIRL